jgi:hypothetical protein
LASRQTQSRTNQQPERAIKATVDSARTNFNRTAELSRHPNSVSGNSQNVSRSTTATNRTNRSTGQSTISDDLKQLRQQQKLQIATVAENHQLKEHVRKLSGLLETSGSTQKQQANGKDNNLSNNANAIHGKDKNNNQNENKVAEYDNRQEKSIKSKINNSWWHFW